MMNLFQISLYLNSISLKVTLETSGPDKCKFYCRIVINDLPQKVRWNIVQRESLSKIIDESRTSITTRGQYYPPGSNHYPMIKKEMAV